MLLEEKVAERTEKLLFSENRFSLLFHEHAAVFLLVDPDSGALIDANKSAADFYGYSIAELKNLKISDINILPSDEVVAKMKQAATDEAHHFIFQHRLQNGELRTVETHSTLIDLGEKSVLFSVIQDISKRQKAEDALRIERTHLHTLVNTMPDLVWLKDRDGVYLSCNNRFEQFLGVPGEEIIGRNDYDFVSRELADFFLEHDRKAMQAGGPSVNEEVVQFASDGHSEHLETIKTPMFDEDGTLIGVLGIARDIFSTANRKKCTLKS